MQTYNGRQEAKMRSEALKPPVSYGAMPPGPSSMPPDVRGPPAYADPRGPSGYDMSGGAYGGSMGAGYGGYSDYSYGSMGP